MRIVLHCYLGKVDKMFSFIMINIWQPIAWCLQPVIPLPWTCFNSHIAIVGVVRWKVATLTVVAVWRLKNSWPIVLKIFCCMIAICLSIVKFHCWNMASVSVNIHVSTNNNSSVHNTLIHCVSKKCPCLDFYFDMHESILMIFGRTVKEKTED